MALQQKILWTGLPNGIVQTAEGTSLRVSVLVSPRLYGTAPTTLRDYPDFQRWAAIVAGIQFSVSFKVGNFGTTVQARRDPDSPAPDQDLWGALFTAATPVEPFAFTDLSQRFIWSHPARQIHSLVKTTYGVFTTHDTFYGVITPPSWDTVKNVVNPYLRTENLLRTPDYWKHLYGGQGNAVPPGKLDAPGALPQPGDRYARQGLLHIFYNRPVPQTANFAQERPAQKEPDFHGAVAAMAQYARLMRQLGLVVDLLVPLVPGIPRNAAGSSLQIVPAWQSATPVGRPHILPRTYYTLTNTSFAATSNSATPQEAEFAGGMLNLSKQQKFDGVTSQETFELVQIDVDGAGLKMTQYKNAAEAAQQIGTSLTSQAAPLPALRSAGLAILKHGHAWEMAQRFRDMKNRNDRAEAGLDLDLYAEDLIRGYRVDVHDAASGAWRSLMQRDGTYHLAHAPEGKQTFTLTDEAYMSVGVAQTPGDLDKSADRDLYLHDQLFRWTGWSLATPMPGKAIADDGTLVAPDNIPGKNFQMRVDFKVTPGSLPRLRFGQQYRVRARTVDLAGNSLPPESTIDTYAAPPPGQPPLTYRRIEPVIAPVIVPRRAFTHPDSPGEALERMVLRSDLGVPADQYPQQLATAGYPGFHADSQRHIVPPQTSEEMAERHGMFDLPNSGMDLAAYDTLVARDGTFGTTDTGELAAYDVDQLDLPYLPEVLARGAAFAGLPGSTGPQPAGSVPVDHYPYSGSWPARAPFRVVLQGLLDSEAQQPPQLDPNSGVLTVWLKQGDMVDVQLNSYFDPTDLDLMGMWAWAMEYYPFTGAKPPASLTAAAVAGLLWWLTPSRRLTLVHAVQRPLIQPQFDLLFATRTQPGQTSAYLENHEHNIEQHIKPMPISGKSTGKLDILADWQEPIDTGAGDADKGFHYVNGHAHVLEVPVQPADTEIYFDTQKNVRVHHLPDTKHRKIAYTAVATTRFREYFPFTDAEIASGTASITQTSPPAETHVFSSAPPDAPKVLYAVPAFKWDEQQNGNQTVSTRQGGYLRVYMDRPWFSSGDGELLGVVVADVAPAQAADLQTRAKAAAGKTMQRLGFVRPLDAVATSLQPYVTQWGRDPLHQSSAPAGLAPTLRAFPLAAPAAGGQSQGDLPLTEVQFGRVAVAGHAVGWDKDRQLWYADIQMSWGDSYYPFVRLALARFQPFSLPGAHLSRVVQADFVQLAPNRTATVTSRSDPSDLRKVSVSVAGSTFTDPATGGAGTQVVVSVEARQPNVPGELGWTPVPNSTKELQAQRQRGTSQLIWSADILLPRPVGTTPYRLVIKEYEPFDATDSNNQKYTTRRLVYAATVEV